MDEREESVGEGDVDELCREAEGCTMLLRVRFGFFFHRYFTVECKMEGCITTFGRKFNCFNKLRRHWEKNFRSRRKEKKKQRSAVQKSDAVLATVGM